MMIELFPPFLGGRGGRSSMQNMSIDLSTRLRGVTYSICAFIPQALLLRSIVNFKISKLAYWKTVSNDFPNDH